MNAQSRAARAAIRILARASARRDRTAYHDRPPETTMRGDWKKAVDPMRKQLEPWG
jgi:hypothetical protein